MCGGTYQCHDGLGSELGMGANSDYTRLLAEILNSCLQTNEGAVGWQASVWQALLPWKLGFVPWEWVLVRLSSVVSTDHKFFQRDMPASGTIKVVCPSHGVKHNEVGTFPFAIILCPAVYIFCLGLWAVM